jgi:hypothetical protein
MRNLVASLCLPLSLVGAACGSEDPPPGDCVGHECPSAVDEAEGGNIIFEYIYFDTQLQAAFMLPQGVETATRVMGYFMNAHNPDANPLPAAGECTNLEATRGWPLFVAQEREDLDIGDLTITGVNESDEPTTMDIPLLTAMNDQIGRPHDIFYQTVIPDAAEQQKPNSSYDVTFTGNGEIAATTMPDAIVLAGDFTVNSPDIEDDGPLIAGTDFPVAWTPGTTTGFPTDDPSVIGGDVLGVTWLVDVTGSPTHICPVLHSSGSFTIPGSAIEEYREVAVARGLSPDNMILLRNAIVHRVERLPNGDDDNVRRIDMLSVLCWAQLMNVEAAAI